VINFFHFSLELQPDCHRLKNGVISRKHFELDFVDFELP
jgi:hypothetical protein